MYSDGTPISFSEIHIFDDKGYGWSSGHTNHLGEFSLSLRNGTYTIKIGDKDRPIIQSEILVNGEDITNLVFTSVAEVFSIEGIATFSNGYPILSYGVFITGDTGYRGHYGTVKSDGSFFINALPKGTYTLKFGSSEDPLAEVVVAVEENVKGLNVVSPYEAVEVKGNMVDSDGETFTFSHFIEDKDRKIQFARLTSLPDSDGIAVYYLPKNRTYELKYRHEGYVLNSPKSFDVGSDDIESITFTLSQPTYTVSGTVYDSNGNPVTGQGITVKYGNGSTYGRSDSEDRFRRKHQA